MRSHKTEFPEVVIEPEILETLGSMFFLDASWHNDSCPSFAYEFPDRSSIQVYVAQQNPAEREFDEQQRFTVQHILEEGELLDHSFETSDLATLREYLIAAKIKGTA
jgi:hypothetical protein